MSDTFDHEADAWDSLLFYDDEADDIPYRMRRKSITCKYCSKTGFAWKQTPNGWRLVDMKGTIHSCLNK